MGWLILSLAREQLPIPDTKHVGLTTYDAKDPNTKYPPIRELRPPAGVPNVLIVLIDDVGFGASSAFGGPCQTPVAERLAAGGVKLNRFHTTALCSPTRQALPTGRNHHSVGMGAITEMAISAPGNNSIRPVSSRRSRWATPPTRPAMWARHRIAGLTGIRAHRQPLHRPDRLGAARYGRRQP